jgi:1-acyl-sn-glycerol-3-phosphate acyltransferase
MLYRILRFIFRVYLRSVHRLRIVGTEHIPAEGPLILCANHTSYFDSMLMALCCRRPVRFLITETFYHHPLLGQVIQRCGAIPVSLEGDVRHLLRRGLAVLADGGVLGIFPEGRLSRTGATGHGEPGAALLAAASGAPIIPISIAGAFDVFPKGQRTPRPGSLTVTIHPPLSVESRRRDRVYLRHVTDRLMALIASGARTDNSPLPR